MAEEVKENSYRNILKGASIFGGVQFFQILINVVRGKFVAMFLGPEGMGISALFTASSNTIQKFSSLGLNLSIVREIAAASGDKSTASAVLGVALRIICATSLLGAIACLLFARPLSRLTFGDESMTWQFMLLGVAVAFGIAGTGMLSILQGLHFVKRLSKAAVVGGLTGLFAGVPLYYYFGSKGIVPAMIILSVVMFLFYYVSLRQSDVIKPFRFSYNEHKPVIRRLVSLGLILMASDVIGTLVSYSLNLFIRTFGSVSDVGLYQGANTITSQYSGVVFAIMAMDYFPRLSKAAADNRLVREIVNRQTEVVSLIITPASTLLIITAPIVIHLLLTKEFATILPLMRWMGLGIMFRAIMMPMAYITFAKGNRKVFFYLEGLLCNILTLSLSCLGFYFFGIIGLGYALVADNSLCILIYYAVNRRLYGYRLSRQALTAMSGAIVLTAACFLFSLLSNRILSYSLMSLICAASTAWAAVTLRRKLRRTSIAKPE